MFFSFIYPFIYFSSLKNQCILKVLASLFLVVFYTNVQIGESSIYLVTWAKVMSYKSWNIACQSDLSMNEPMALLKLFH